MNMKHTLGRAMQDAGEPIVRGEDGERIATCYRLFDGDRTKTPEVTGMENARRLAACWNACDGISTEVLEKYHSHGGIEDAFDENKESLLDELQAQRDELLKTLQRISVIVNTSINDCASLDKVADLAKKAIGNSEWRTA